MVPLLSFRFWCIAAGFENHGYEGHNVGAMWGMAYLLSFLMLEGLDLLTPRKDKDNASSKKYCETFSNSSVVLFLVFYLWELSGIFPESVFRNKRQGDHILKSTGLTSTLLVPWITIVLLSCIVTPCGLATLFYKLNIPTNSPLGSVLRPTLQPFMGDFTKVIQIGAACTCLACGSIPTLQRSQPFYIEIPCQLGRLDCSHLHNLPDHLDLCWLPNLTFQNSTATRAFRLRCFGDESSVFAVCNSKPRRNLPLPRAHL